MNIRFVYSSRGARIHAYSTVPAYFAGVAGVSQVPCQRFVAAPDFQNARILPHCVVPGCTSKNVRNVNKGDSLFEFAHNVHVPGMVMSTRQRCTSELVYGRHNVRMAVLLVRIKGHQSKSRVWKHANIEGHKQDAARSEGSNANPRNVQGSRPTITCHPPVCCSPRYNRAGKRQTLKVQGAIGELKAIVLGGLVIPRRKPYQRYLPVTPLLSRGLWSLGQGY